jgi:hypothetical protein
MSESSGDGRSGAHGGKHADEAVCIEGEGRRRSRSGMPSPRTKSATRTVRGHFTEEGGGVQHCGIQARPIAEGPGR